MIRSNHTARHAAPGLTAAPRHRLYRIILWIILAILLVGLMSCAAGNGETSTAQQAGVASDSSRGGAVRLLLAGTAIQDSAKTISDFHVDQVLRQVLDSIPGARYLTLNYRDSLALARDPSGRKGVALSEIGRRLGLDGAIFASVARFGSVVAVDLRVVEPLHGATIFHDLAFSQARYRDSAGTMLLGPALYDAVRHLMRRFSALQHSREHPTASAPLVLSGVLIPDDARLGPVAKNRDNLSRSVLSAINDYANLHFPEIVTFDPLSRDRLYETVRIAAVANYLPPGNAERVALFNVGIDHYLLGSIEPFGADSLRLRLEIRYVTSRTGDSVIIARQMEQPRTMFSSTAYDEDVTVAMLDLAEPLLREFSSRIATDYEKARQARLTGASTRGAR